MYLGKVVESGEVNSVFSKPLHPYTKALINSSPEIDPTKTIDDYEVIEGELPSPVNPPTGCHFHARCKDSIPECKNSYPSEFLQDNKRVKCHLYSPDRESISMTQ